MSEGEYYDMQLPGISFELSIFAPWSISFKKVIQMKIE